MFGKSYSILKYGQNGNVMTSIQHGALIFGEMQSSSGRPG